MGTSDFVVGFLQVCRLQRCGLRSGWGQATAASSIWGLGPREGRVGLKSFFWALNGLRDSERFFSAPRMQREQGLRPISEVFHGFFVRSLDSEDFITLPDNS